LGLAPAFHLVREVYTTRVHTMFLLAVATIAGKPLFGRIWAAICWTNYERMASGLR
jgi:hypothetical protein